MQCLCADDNVKHQYLLDEDSNVYGSLTYQGLCDLKLIAVLNSPNCLMCSCVVAVATCTYLGSNIVTQVSLCTFEYDCHRTIAGSLDISNASNYHAIKFVVYKLSRRFIRNNNNIYNKTSTDLVQVSNNVKN